MPNKPRRKTATKRVRELKEDLKALREQLMEKDGKLEEYLSRLRYLQADFENYRKRAEKEREEQVKMANQALIHRLLRIYEDLERGLEEARDADLADPVVEGLELTWKNFHAILEDEGLSRIDAIGKKFDPFLHEAVEVQVGDCEPGMVVEELQRGYTLGGRVIKPAKVKICKKADKEKQQKEE
ncbi:MAG: nucleotide exchange factor GrpE [Candidatus Geothermarchaeales archaeon]